MSNTISIKITTVTSDKICTVNYIYFIFYINLQLQHSLIL